MPDLPEQQASIDAMLVAAGWAVQDYKVFDHSASTGIALCEVPLKSRRCDYLSDLATVAPDARTKTCFVPVDAVGVNESNSHSMKSKPTVAFGKPLQQFARGFRNEDTLIQVA